MRIKRKIYAAEEDMDRGFDEDMFNDDSDVSEDETDDNISIRDELDNLSSDLDDLKGMLEDEVFEEGSSIDIDNNIEDHYIAECEQCKGIFISAVVKSDQKIDKISGTCPLCEKDTDQYLRWVIVSSQDS